MIANSTELRELADLLNKFPGIRATEWAPGEEWVLTFEVQGTTHTQTLIQVAVLNVLVVQPEGRVGIDYTRFGPTRYTLYGGDVDKLTFFLQNAHKNLWRQTYRA